MNLKPEQNPFQPIAEIEAIIDQIPPQNIGEAITAIIIYSNGKDPQQNLPEIATLIQGIKEGRFDTDDLLKTLETKYHLQYNLAEKNNASKKKPENSTAETRQSTKAKVGRVMLKTSHKGFSSKGGPSMKTSYTKLKPKKSKPKKATPVGR